MKYNFINKSYIKDYILNINQYKEQTLLKGTPAKVNMFLNLLFLEPNSFQHKPDLGFGITSKIHILDTIENVSEFENELRTQCNKFLPFTIYNLDVTLENSKGDVTIEVMTEDDDIFRISGNKNNIFDINIEIPEKDFNQ